MQKDRSAAAPGAAPHDSIIQRLRIDPAGVTPLDPPPRKRRRADGWATVRTRTPRRAGMK
jgi:hypothetical protein